MIKTEVKPRRLWLQSAMNYFIQFTMSELNFNTMMTVFQPTITITCFETQI